MGGGGVVNMVEVTAAPFCRLETFSHREKASNHNSTATL